MPGNFELRPYQEDGLNAIWDYFYSGNKGNPVLAWPTGTGKSLVPAIFIKKVMQKWPDQRFILLTHISDLISQNAAALLNAWPNAPLGIHSAGLGHRHTAFQIIYAGIQSAIKDPRAFGHRDIAFVDEAHLVSQDDASMYLKFFAVLKSINPNLKIIGLSATPFRIGQGLITDNGLFTDIIHDLTEMNAFNKLIADGYLSLLIPHKTNTILDISSVGITKGEFVAKQLQAAVDKNEITNAALQEAIEAGHNRQSWMIFATGIEHAEHIADMMGTFGIDCAAVHSKKPKEYNLAAIKALKDGSLRSVVNVVKLTTGIDVPRLDYIIDLQPTMSPIRHVQKLGRGTRISPDTQKSNCLVLDFGRNVPRLGPINCPVIPKKKGEKPGDAPIKLCPSCGAYNYAGARFCCDCGTEFLFQTKLVTTSGTEELVKGYEQPVIETFEVGRALYLKAQKTGKPPYIKAIYFTGTQSFTEFVFPQHGGYVTKLFHDWWKKRHTIEPPQSTDEALQYIAQLRVPKKIRVHLNTKYPQIISVEF